MEKVFCDVEETMCLFCRHSSYSEFIDYAEIVLKDNDWSEEQQLFAIFDLYPAPSEVYANSSFASGLASGYAKLVNYNA